MKEDVERPGRLIDINRLALREIRRGDDGGLRIGALVTNTDVAYDAAGRAALPAAVPGDPGRRLGAAPQHGDDGRQPACSGPAAPTSTTPPRPATSASPARGCSAIDGFNRIHAILGHSEHCIATHPSDMCVALAALEAVVRVDRAGRRARDPVRRVPPPARRHARTSTPTCGPDEIITAVDLPAEGFAEHHAYLKIRDRPSYAFALVSVAAALEMDGGTIAEARLALGGVAHKPWRDREAEAMLRGAEPTQDNFAAGGRGGPPRRARASSTTTSRSSWRGAPIVRALAEAAGGGRRHERPPTSASRSAASTAAPR